MSISVYFHDDLLCKEEEEEDSRLPYRDQMKCSSSLDEFNESVTEFIEAEKNFVPGLDYVKRLQSRSLDQSAREESIAWIVKVRSHYGFQPLTAYLSINYLDRFLHSRNLSINNGWTMQLLSVACLSLAVKMEEPLVPSLLDLQIEGSKFVFETKIIQRMELLILGVLDWRLRSITPFTFLSYFASKLDNHNTDFIISKSTEIIMSNIQEINLLEYQPSTIAAATVLHISQTISNLSCLISETWFDQEHIKEKITSCYELIEKVSVRKPPKVLSQLRVMTTQAWIELGDSPSPSRKRKRENEIE
ncbi:cyclin-D1-1-like [Impatiens glandulifera]|uniref:cyclin-D1-1-like n=1 Tax=Impatiens glandulifera TaxID=253017 RepID=UPI001FB081E0|nr:cyclin-D1-1-like [Impatiens glandulifera]